MTQTTPASTSRWRSLRKRTPRAVRLAVAIAVVFAAVELCGLRSWVSVVCGTPVPDVPFAVAGPAGFFYVLAWLAFVVVAPILLLASGIDALLRRALGERRRPIGSDEEQEARDEARSVS